MTSGPRSRALLSCIAIAGGLGPARALAAPPVVPARTAWPLVVSCSGPACARPGRIGYLELDGPPVARGGHVHLVTRVGGVDLDPRRCLLVTDWLGTSTGRIDRTAPTRIVELSETDAIRRGLDGFGVAPPAERHFPVAVWEADLPAPGDDAILRVYRTVVCDGGRELTLPVRDAVGPRAARLVCTAPAEGHAPAPVTIEAGDREVRLVPRANLLLRVDGTRLVDRCTGKLLLDVASLGRVVASIGGERDDALTDGERLLALSRTAHPAPVADQHPGPTVVTLTLAAPLTADAARALARALAHVPGMTTIYSWSERHMRGK